MFPFLYTLLLVLIVAGSALAVGPIGLVLSPLIGILALLLALTKYIWEAFLCFVAILVGIALLLPAVSCANEAARRMQCTNNLKQIALALHNYHQTFKCFPPAYVTDKSDKPMHSWRVLILPFMEQQQLYDKYRFDELWDSPNNRKLLDECPRVYGCPSDKSARDGRTIYTSYVAIVGPNAAWEGAKPRSLDNAELRGKDKSTVLLVESNKVDIPWLAPEDIALGSQAVVSSCHEREADDFFHCDVPAAHAAMVNGFIRSIPAGIQSDNPLLRIGGCRDKALRDFWNARINWSHCIGLPIWLVSVGLLLHQAVRCRR